MKYFVLCAIALLVFSFNGYSQLGNLGNMFNTNKDQEPSEPPPPNYTITYNVNISGTECNAELNLGVLNTMLEKTDTGADQINDQINQMVFSNKELPADASFGMSRDDEYTEFTVQLEGTAQSCSNVNALIKNLESMLKQNFGNTSSSNNRLKLF